jgi:ribosomal protein S18 acetylase RimI-like enzyme
VLDLFPVLLPALTEAGFPEPDHYPLMILTREALRPAKLPGLEVRPVHPADDLRAVVQVPALAFEGKGEVPDDEVERFRASLGSGRPAFAAFVEGLPVSFGVHVPVGSLAEMAGVGTHPDHQRNGYAAAVCTALAEDAFAHGCNAVFLTAGTDQARRLYTRLGFQRIGTGLGATLSQPST